MANLNDIATIADALQKPSIAVRENRCVAVRNRHASCRKCMDICDAKAIEVDQNEINYSASLCINCGACAVVCPTEALLTLNPTGADITEAAFEVADKTEGKILFACARIASKHIGNPNLYVEVPCLAHINPSLLLTFCASKAKEIVLLDGDCSTCKYGWCNSCIGAVVEETNNILEREPIDLRVRREDKFPDYALIDSSDGQFGTSRRGFFSQAITSMKETALTAARATLNEKLGETNEEESIGERLRVTANGTMPQFSMPCHEQAINAIDQMGIPQCDSLNTSLFGTINIDTDKCNSCGMCAVFCPTGALVKAESSSKRNNALILEFLACDCVQCNLCENVCWKDALRVGSNVSVEQLFDFEPVSFTISNQGQSNRAVLGKKGSK